MLLSNNPLFLNRLRRARRILVLIHPHRVLQRADQRFAVGAAIAGAGEDFAGRLGVDLQHVDLALAVDREVQRQLAERAEAVFEVSGSFKPQLLGCPHGLVGLLFTAEPLLQQHLCLHGMAPAVEVRGDAAGSAYPAGHAGEFPGTLAVLLHEHPVIVEPAARQAQRDALLDQEPAAQAPLADDGLQSVQRYLAGRDDLPALAASLNIVEGFTLTLPFDPQDTASAGAVDRLDVNDRTELQHPVQIRGRLI